jgi:hypothetical protein
MLREPHQGHDALDRSGDVIECTPARLEKVCLQQQILWRITIQGELREDDQLNSLGSSPIEIVADLPRVRLDVAHGRIDLGKRQTHWLRHIGHHPSDFTSRLQRAGRAATRLRTWRP